MSLLAHIDQQNNDRGHLERLFADRDEYRERELIMIAQTQESDLLRIESAFEIREREWRCERDRMRCLQEAWEGEKLSLLREIADAKAKRSMAVKEETSRGEDAMRVITHEMHRVAATLVGLTGAVETLTTQWSEDRTEWRRTHEDLLRAAMSTHPPALSPPQGLRGAYAQPQILQSIDALRGELAKRHDLEDRVNALTQQGKPSTHSPPPPQAGVKVDKPSYPSLPERVRPLLPEEKALGPSLRPVQPNAGLVVAPPLVPPPPSPKRLVDLVDVRIFS